MASDRRRTCRHCSSFIMRSDQRCSNDSYCTPIDWGGLFDNPPYSPETAAPMPSEDTKENRCEEKEEKESRDAVGSVSRGSDVHVHRVRSQGEREGLLDRSSRSPEGVAGAGHHPDVRAAEKLGSHFRVLGEVSAGLEQEAPASGRSEVVHVRLDEQAAPSSSPAFAVGDVVAFVNRVPKFRIDALATRDGEAAAEMTMIRDDRGDAVLYKQLGGPASLKHAVVLPAAPFTSKEEGLK